MAYSNAIPNGFVFDDLSIVKDNPRLRAWSELPGLSMAGYWESEGNSDLLWRPLTMASFLANARMLGLEPEGYHAVNALLNGAASGAVAALALRTGLAGAGGVAAGMAFAVHPIHADAAASIVGRAELLGAIFFLLALLAWMRWLQEAAPTAALLCALWLFLALASKENAATFPLVAGLAALLPFPGARPMARAAMAKRFLAGGIPIVLALALYLALRSAALGAFRQQPPSALPGLLYGVGHTARFLTASKAYALYLWLMAWPARLTADYSFDAIPLAASWADPVALIGLALLAMTCLAAALLWRRAPAAGFGLAFYPATFCLTSNFLIPIMSLMAERLAYLPSAGLALAFGSACGSIWHRVRRPRIRAALAAAFSLACLLWLARTWARNRDWATNESLFASAARAYPECARAHYNLGDVYRVEKMDYPAAEKEYLRGLEILPADAMAWVNVGNVRSFMGRYREALEAYRRARAIEASSEGRQGIEANMRRAQEALDRGQP